jgi:hypothetical protein
MIVGFRAKFNACKKACSIILTMVEQPVALAYVET